MTKTAMAMLTIGLAAAGATHAKTNSANEAQTITVCVQTQTPIVNVFGLSYAKKISEQIMASAGVWVKWTECGRSVSNDEVHVVIDVISGAPNDDHPGALAYARPFEGTHIVVMADRFGFAGRTTFSSLLLGHVMSHELAHLLQGYPAHSSEGIMKAQWTGADFARMQWRPMLFSAGDTERIQVGLRARRQGAALRATAKPVEGSTPML